MLKIICAVSVLFISTQTGFAANQFVRCVQEQLVSLGQDPGPIDGALGKRTRLALDKATAGKPKFETLPRISNRFAVTWCRALANEGFRTRSHIPFFDGVVVKSDLVEGSQIEAKILNDIRLLRIWYGQEFNIRTASRPIVVIAQSGKSAVSMAQQAAKDMGVRAIDAKSTQRKCKEATNGRTAFAGSHIIYFCLTNLKREGAYVPRELLWFLNFAVPHEYFHSVQRELAADKVTRYYRKGTRPPPEHLRPSWLVEGSADYLAQLYLYQKVPRSMIRSRVFDAAAPFDQTLKDIAKERRLTKSEHYSVSLLAAQLLGDKNGPESFIKYWEQIGYGVKHGTAFETAFGITRIAFEAEFETLRKDLSKINAYVR
jgi:hypothetical protein